MGMFWSWATLKYSGHRGGLQILIERRQETIAQREKAILNSKWAIAFSKRLLAELDKLRADRKGASRYSLCRRNEGLSSDDGGARTPPAANQRGGS
jgi:hypothetical protein